MEPEPEIWRPVYGHEGSYEVSDQGRVRSLDRRVWRRPSDLRSGHWMIQRGRLLRIKPGNHQWKYQTARICVAGEMETRPVHHLVLEAFVGPRPEGMIGRHLDDDKHNNHPSNLAWGTDTENKADAARNGIPIGWGAFHLAKTHCAHGHPYAGENLRVDPRTGWRICRACERSRKKLRTDG